jgi:hypothetical protein
MCLNFSHASNWWNFTCGEKARYYEVIRVINVNEFSSYFKASNLRLQYKAEALNSVQGKNRF